MNAISASLFDSEHFGIKVGKLHASEMSPERLRKAIVQAKKEQYDVVFARILQSDAARKRRILDAGGKKIDTLVTLSRKHSNIQIPVICPQEFSIEQAAIISDRLDLATIGKICENNIYNSHFHNDRRLSLKKTGQLHFDWAVNNACGRAAQTVLARKRKKIVGFLQILMPKVIRRNNGSAAIDLIVVDRKHQGKKVGSALLASALNWLSGQVHEITVGTQESNPAFKLYLKFGFKAVKYEETHHLWLDKLKNDKAKS